MSSPPPTAFGKLRSFFWPIHSHEIKKVIPMLCMMLLICFNYSVLRNLKDTVVVTAKSSGAEVIPFIKVWAMLPMAVLFTYIFTKLSNRYSREKVFYSLVTSFLLFFIVFAYVLYPNQHSIHPTDLADRILAVAPKGFYGLIAMVRYWSFTLFYVMAELWGSIILSVLFWGFANEITSVEESRRFYGILGVAANGAAVLAGVAANFLTKGKSWDASFTTLINVIIANGIISIFIFRWMNKNVLKKEENSGPCLKTKKKLGIRESFRFLANSKYLLYIAVLVISYNLVINLVEVIWKSELRQLYPLPEDYNSFMNTMTTWVGIFSSITAFFLSRLIGRFGWTTIALTTPLLMLTTSIGFFLFFFFRQELEPVSLSFFGTSALAMTVFFGASQVCLSKAAKYSVFDTTKEMAFIPLNQESKIRGKASIDGVGSRFGKSGGALVHQGFLMFFGNLTASAPWVAVVLFTVIGFWITATKALGLRYIEMANKVDEEKELIETQEAKAKEAIA